ncbi:DUF664 domain-containing protein [Nakamurella sp. A5-74]|uniref:DUF664 domain-containing protein n=1 Tax=Nakamurella sp. A5-74 TaxID=3158264 RepID=A0AAU8DSQ1_9ACTN
MARTDPPLDGTEFETLSGFADFLRETIWLKTEGLDSAGLAVTLAPSDMTLGGMLKHLAYVEDYWVGHILLGREPAAPWDSAPWDDDADWDWHSAADDSPEQTRSLWRATVETSRTDFPTDLDRISARANSRGMHFSARWVLTHLIEEYGRHAGHADLIRQSIDGVTGE